MLAAPPHQVSAGSCCRPPCFIWSRCSFTVEGPQHEGPTQRKLSPFPPQMPASRTPEEAHLGPTLQAKAQGSPTTIATGTVDAQHEGNATGATVGTSPRQWPSATASWWAPDELVGLLALVPAARPDLNRSMLNTLMMCSMLAAVVLEACSEPGWCKPVVNSYLPRLVMSLRPVEGKSTCVAVVR